MPEFDPFQKSVTEQIFRSDRSRRLPTLLLSQFWEQPFTNRIFLFFAQGSNQTRRGMIGGLATGVGAATVISSGTRRVSDGFGKQGHKATRFHLPGWETARISRARISTGHAHIGHLQPGGMGRPHRRSPCCLVHAGFPASGALERFGNCVSDIGTFGRNSLTYSGGCSG